VSWNLLTLLSGPASVAVAEAQQELGETRRLALSMATLTQVHVGYQQYQRARRNFEQAELLNSIEQRIYDNTRNAEAGDAQNVLERVRAAASAISAELSRDRAYADVQAATANLVVSLGLDPLPAEVPSHDIKTLSQALAAMNVNWQSGQLFPPAPVPVSLAPPGPVKPVETAAPVAKVEPVETVTPVAKVEPVEAVAPVAKAEPVATIVPVKTVTPIAKVEPIVAVTPVARIEPVSLVTSPSAPASTDRKSNPTRKPLISNFR
jgi:hypothetical protein